MQEKTSEVDNKWMWPVNLRFFVGINLVGSAIYLVFANIIVSFAKVKDAQKRASLAEPAKEAKEFVALSKLDNIVAY